jgi:hypothetical protein
VILVHLALHKNQAILCPVFIVMNAGRRVKEISFKNGIGIADASDMCINEKNRPMRMAHPIRMSDFLEHFFQIDHRGLGVQISQDLIGPTVFNQFPHPALGIH